MHIINTVYGVAEGGRWQVLMDYSFWLKDAGHDVTIIIDKKAGEPIQTLEKAGCNIIRLANSGFYDPIATTKLWFLLRKLKPDAIISHGGRSTSLFQRSKPKDTPLIAVNHSNNVKRSLCADIFFNISSHIESLIKEKTPQGLHYRVFNCPRESTTHSPRELTPPIELSFLGRLTLSKGLDVLLNSLVILKERNIDFTCSIAGSGDTETFIKLRNKLGLKESVSFVGHVDSPINFLSNSHIFCFPTLGEGFPISPLEAFAAGCAVVGTDDPGTAELLEHGKIGLIAPRGDIQAFSDNLIFLIENPEFYLDLAQRSQKKYFEQYTPDKAKKRFLYAVEDSIRRFKSST